MKIRLILLIGILLFSISAYALSPGLREYTNPKPAEKFSLPDMAETIHQIEDYKDKAFIFSFWATWCVPCIKEMPSLERAAAILEDDEIAILAVNSGESKQDVEKFLDRVPVTLPILLDSDSKVMDRWKVLALPTSYIVNVDGSVVARVVGGLEWDDPSVIEQVRTLTSTAGQQSDTPESIPDSANQSPETEKYDGSAGH